MSKFGGKRAGRAALVLLALIVVGSGIYAVGRREPEQKQSGASRQASYREPSTGIEVKYPEQTAKSQPLTDSDKKEKILLRLTAQQGQAPMLVTLRSETGLRLVANLTKATIIDILMRNSDKALPQRFEGFKKESSRRYEHQGRSAGEILFTYDSPVPNERIKQKLVMVVKDDDTAVYLAMQSKEADFQEKNRKVFDSMASSLSFH